MNARIPANRKTIGGTTHFILVARLWVVSGNNHKMEWQPSHSNGVWLSDSKLHTPVEWRQLHPLYTQLQPRQTRRHPKSQVDNALEDLKGAKGTNATTINKPSYHLNIYICTIYIPIIHNCIFKFEWIPPPLIAGAPKFKTLKTTTQGTPRRERPNSVYVMMLTVKLCCPEGLAILVSKALVFLSRIGSVGWVWWFSICDAL